MRFVECVKQRLVVLTDISNEPDDEQSLVRLLVYASDFDIEGLVATTSVHRRSSLLSCPWGLLAQAKQLERPEGEAARLRRAVADLTMAAGGLLNPKRTHVTHVPAMQRHLQQRRPRPTRAGCQAPVPWRRCSPNRQRRSQH